MMEHDGENPWKIRRRFQNTKPGITCLTLLDPILCSFNIFPSVKSAAKKKKYLDSVVCWYDWCPFCPFSINSRAVLARGSLLRPRNFSDSIKMLKLCPHPPERSWQCYVKAISPVDIAESTLLLFSSSPHHQPKKQHESWVFNLSNPIPLILNWHHLGCV